MSQCYTDRRTASWYSSVELTAPAREGKNAESAAAAITENLMVTIGRTKFVQELEPTKRERERGRENQQD